MDARESYFLDGQHVYLGVLEKVLEIVDAISLPERVCTSAIPCGNDDLVVLGLTLFDCFFGFSWGEERMDLLMDSLSQ